MHFLRIVATQTETSASMAWIARIRPHPV